MMFRWNEFVNWLKFVIDGEIRKRRKRGINFSCIVVWLFNISFFIHQHKHFQHRQVKVLELRHYFS